MYGQRGFDGGIQGSTRKGNNPGFKTGPRTKPSGRSPSQLLGSSSSSLQSVLLREFRETGIYGHAEDIGIIRNGELSLMSNGSSGDHDVSSGTGEGRDIHGGMQFGQAAVGPSVSMDNGSMGSPAQGTEATMGTPGPNGIPQRLQHPESIDDPESPDVVGRKKKRGQRSTAGEKGGKGLRHFSMKVCEKVESKIRTTYNEVADELVSEFTNPDNLLVTPDQQQQYDEKNIRRRVYDALNVLMAMDIISKEKKEIQWIGLPTTIATNAEALKAEKMKLVGLMEKKAAYLQELDEQITGLQNLVDRNGKIHHNNPPSGGVALPFIIVQTRPQATVEIEISEDMQLVHFDFNSTPFELHDDAYVLKAMNFSENTQNNNTVSRDVPFTDCEEGFEHVYDDHPSPVSNLYNRPAIMAMSPRPGPGSHYSVSTSSPPPVPSILKARVKHENYA